MKILLLIVVVFFVLTNIFSQEIYFDDNRKESDKRLLQLETIKRVQNKMPRKSGQSQFFGLMGKRRTGKKYDIHTQNSSRF